MRLAAALLLGLGLISLGFAAFDEYAPDRSAMSQMIPEGAGDLQLFDLLIGAGLLVAASALLFSGLARNAARRRGRRW
jgi:hypothetical protein